LFPNVLKKFFTGRGKYENKEATRYRRCPMIAEWKAVLTRSAPGLAGDAAGVLALVAMLVVGLALPSLI
jgi:hypothetical protein